MRPSACASTKLASVRPSVLRSSASLRGAAQLMGLSYSKALAIVKRAEAELGFALTEKTIGGRGGGGSRLTLEAETFLHKYEVYRDACSQANREIYHTVFGGQP